MPRKNGTSQTSSVERYCKFTKFRASAWDWSTGDVSAQQGIDITSCLDEQSQALNLSAVSCRVDGVLARQTDCSLCCEWDESSQDSAKVSESSHFNFWRQNTKGEEHLRRNLDIVERCSLEQFELRSGDGCGKNSGKQWRTEVSLLPTVATLQSWGAVRFIIQLIVSPNLERTQPRGMFFFCCWFLPKAVVVRVHLECVGIAWGPVALYDWLLQNVPLIRSPVDGQLVGIAGHVGVGTMPKQQFNAVQVPRSGCVI